MKCKEFCNLSSKEQTPYEEEYRKHMHGTYYAVLEDGYIVGIYDKETYDSVLSILNEKNICISDTGMVVRQVERRPCMFADITFNFVEGGENE